MIGISVPVGRHRAPEGQIGWLERTVAGITGSIEGAVFSEHLAREAGWLQRRDPRAKLVGLLVLILAASLTASLVSLALLYAVALLAARVSRVPLGFFVRRVWAGIPVFAAIVAIPAIFIVPGPRVFDVALGALHIAPSWNGVSSAILFVARVGVSVSFAVLLVLTTPWADVLKSLRALHVPQVFVLVLSMTYRYIFLFLHTANGMLLARKSRVVGRAPSGEQRRWVIGSLGALMARAFKMSNDVYAAMMARGFGGELRTMWNYQMQSADWAGLALASAVAVATVALGRVAA